MHKGYGNRGFTIAEFVVSTVLVVLLVSMTIPATMQLVNQVKTEKSVTDIEAIQGQIDRFYKKNERYPLSLLEIYSSMPLDSWDNPYQYLNIADTPGTKVSKVKGLGLGKIKDKARKYKNLHLINEDYDLYSMGADGQSVPPLTAQPSRDDIIRAGSGRFLGEVSEYINQLD